MAPLVRIEPNDSEFFFLRKPVIAYLRHVFAGRFLRKRLRIWPSRLKPILEMGSFTFHVGSFSETTQFQRYISFFGGKNFIISFAAEVSVFVFIYFAQRFKPVIGFVGFQVIYALLFLMSLYKMLKQYKRSEHEFPLKSVSPQTR
jgi:hypothetical protein